MVRFLQQGKVAPMLTPEPIQPLTYEAFIGLLEQHWTIVAGIGGLVYAIIRAGFIFMSKALAFHREVKNAIKLVEAHEEARHAPPTKEMMVGEIRQLKDVLDRCSESIQSLAREVSEIVGRLE